MDTSRNDLLGELAADAALEKSDFLVSAAAQLDSFLDANESKIRELGGLVLIDDDVDYLAIDEDMTFRSRTRYRDDATGKWVTETETIDSAAELVELYNLADVFAAFAEATTEQAGPKTEAAAEAAGAEPAASGENPYAAAADDWAAGQDFEEAPETEEEAAERLYDLALAFQERSQQTEANLLEQFETAAAALTSVLGELIVVDDDDERLTLKANGSFTAEVVPEEDADNGTWRRLDNPDEIVKFYDPTDIFGDLADSLAEAFPDVAEEPGEGEGSEDEDGDESEGDESEGDESEGDEAEAEQPKDGKADGGKEDGDRR